MTAGLGLGASGYFHNPSNRFVWEWDAIDPSTNTSLHNEQELDLALRWQPSDGRWKGLSVWARYADVFSTGTARDTQPEFRFIVDYTIPLLPR